MFNERYTGDTMEETPTTERPALSLVIPAYRQAATIGQEIRALDALLGTLAPSHEILLVIDGNDDDTLGAVTRESLPPNLRIECFEDNQGKGAALKHGLLLSRGQLVAFIDAGGDLDPSALRIMLAMQELFHADIVIGSKRNSLSEVSYPPLRRIYSWTYQLLNRFLFRLRVRDTQVGVKLFRREVLQAILPRVLVKRFAFDLELLVVAYHRGFNRIVEAPVHIRHGFSSSVNVHAAFQALWDTLAIFYRLRILHWYDRTHDTPAPLSFTRLRPDVPGISPERKGEAGAPRSPGRGEVGQASAFADRSRLRPTKVGRFRPSPAGEALAGATGVSPWGSTRLARTSGAEQDPPELSETLERTPAPSREHAAG